MTRTTKTAPQDATHAIARCAVALLCGIALACLPAAAAQARLGDLDPGFDGDGVALPAIGTPGALDAVLMLPDGKVLAAGTAPTPGNQQPEMLVLRLTAAGGLDPTFGANGVVRHPISEFAELSALALAPGGDVIGVGSAGGDISARQPRVVRISPTGGVTDLNALGVPTEVFPGRLTGVAVLADGGIAVGGTATVGGLEEFMAGRLTGAGTADTSFDVDGWAFAGFGRGIDAEAAALAVAPTGAVTLAGQVATAVGAAPSQAAAARFTPTGLPDPNFGTNGQSTMSFAGIRQFLGAAHTGAGVLATGSLANLAQAVLERLTDAGTPDGSFGSAGMATWPGTPLARGEAVALDSLGGAVVAGRNGNGNVSFLQTRWFTPSGVAAAAGGIHSAVPLIANGTPVGLATGPGDASVVAGTAPNGNPVVARFAPNASPSAALAGGTAQLAGAAQAVVGAPVSFDAGGSSDPEGEPLRFAFDLDGNGSYEFDGGANPFVLRSFPAPGHYTVGVRVSDPRGASATAAHAIDVSAATKPVPRPLLGKQGVAKPLKGIVRFRLPGAKKFVRLDELTTIPNGTEIDARKGRVLLTVLHDASGRLDGAQFYSGRFTFRQGKGKAPITTLTLTGGSFKGCIIKPHAARHSALAVASSLDKGGRSKRKVRKLWGDGRGRFRTRGKYGAATVRGTKWLTQDRCDGTLVRVVRGKVSAEDRVRRRRKDRLIKAGGQIFLPAVQRLRPAVQR